MKIPSGFISSLLAAGSPPSFLAVDGTGTATTAIGGGGGGVVRAHV